MARFAVPVSIEIIEGHISDPPLILRLFLLCYFSDIYFRDNIDIFQTLDFSKY